MSLYSKAVNAIVKAVQENGEELRGIIPNSLCEEIRKNTKGGNIPHSSKLWIKMVIVLTRMKR